MQSRGACRQTGLRGSFRPVGNPRHPELEPGSYVTDVESHRRTSTTFDGARWRAGAARGARAGCCAAAAHQFYMAVLDYEQANSATYSCRDCVMPASTSCPAALASPTQRESPRKETPRPRPLAGAASSLQAEAALQRKRSRQLAVKIHCA